MAVMTGAGGQTSGPGPLSGKQAPGPSLAVCRYGGTGTVSGPVCLSWPKGSGDMLYFRKGRSFSPCS